MFEKRQHRRDVRFQGGVCGVVSENEEDECQTVIPPSTVLSGTSSTILSETSTGEFRVSAASFHPNVSNIAVISSDSRPSCSTTPHGISGTVFDPKKL